MRRIMLLTTGSAILALSLGTSLARASEGDGHDEHVPPRYEERHDAHYDHSVMHGDHRVVRVPPRDIPHEGGVSPFSGTEHRHDGWRYRYDNGAWWYWNTSNHWTYYDNGAWQDYLVDTAVPTVPAPPVTVYTTPVPPVPVYATPVPVAPVPVVAVPVAPVPSDPNYYWYNNQWWYWNTDRHWTYYDHGHWHDGAVGMGPKRREEEHRDIRRDEHERHEDEHARRIEDHEGPR
jgi:hypothetical protein